jgi:acyl-CoA synthetase (AMP-forming)/AMP-acid ligase II
VNVATLLDLAADAAGDRVALGAGTTFADLRERARALAGGLAATGAGRVAYLDATGPGFVETLFAAAWAGLPFAPLNYRLRPAELAAQLSRLGSSLVLVHGEGTAARAAEAARLGGGVPLLPAGTAGPAAGDPPFDPDAIAVLLHTSGTTSEPKAAVLRHRQLFAYVVGAVELASAAPGECALVCVPTYHVAGVASALTTAYAGRRSVHLADFEAGAWLRLAAAERVTHAFVVPTMLVRIVDALEERPELAPASLRVLSYGGAPCPPGLVERALARFPAETGFVNAFGLTETSSTVSVLGPDDHRRAFASADPATRARLRSAGRPLPGVEVRIAADGEVLLRGEQVGGEYLDRPGRVDPDGWFHTGDLGRLDRDGYLFLDGRADDVIIRGGENISPLDVEEALLAHPAVGEAAAVGLPDAEWGQRVAAAVVLRPRAAAGEDELRSFLRERLSSFKVPERIAFLPELPHTATGKLLRRDVARLLQEVPMP